MLDHRQRPGRMLVAEWFQHELRQVQRCLTVICQMSRRQCLWGEGCAFPEPCSEDVGNDINDNMPRGDGITVKEHEKLTMNPWISLDEPLDPFILDAKYHQAVVDLQILGPLLTCLRFGGWVGANQAPTVLLKSTC